MSRKTADIITYIISFIVIVFLLIGFVGCKTKTVYIPVESTEKKKDDTKHNTRDSVKIIEVINTKDSINIKDSIVYKVNEKGEVISKEIYMWKERYRENNYLLKQLQSKYDSLLHVKQTEIIKNIPYPVIEYKEVNKLTWQQEACIWFTKMLLIALSIYSLIKYRKKIMSLLRKLIFK